ncbi:DUF1998 domain-containing protein [Minwuia thermotolerans]|uniref:DUF1998 domain-containing protein n=1 Tax=Minwuia thermotolerans TaxID=2056226 RepID=UPI000D6DC464|nr:DUF1998 domain-containing protein [Minwuia thermotolerans]
MSTDALRLSQLITTFGPGAMVDLPNRSVVIGGLDLWYNIARLETVTEPRLRELMDRELKASGRFPDDRHLTLKRPPVVDEQRASDDGDVAALIFPTWFVCDPRPTASASTSAGGTSVTTADSSKESDDEAAGSRRRLVTWREIDPVSGKYKGDGKAQNVSPIRFVGACKKGHLQDLDWRWLVHGGVTCKAPMWLIDNGTSADPRDVRITCECGQSIELEDLFAPGRLSTCQGRQPWLGAGNQPANCSENLRFLTRGATNAYFPQLASLISLPSSEDHLTELVRKYLDRLDALDSPAEVKIVFKADKPLAREFGGYSEEEVFERVRRVIDQSKPDGGKASAGRVSPKVEEFDVLSSGDRFIGSDQVDSRLYAETLPDADWRVGDSAHVPHEKLIKSVVAVRRLREVQCLYGFTRLEPAPVQADGDLEEVLLAVEGAPLGSDLEWLPAIEQRGEGVFIQFDESQLANLLDEKQHADRIDKMQGAYKDWTKRFQSSLAFPGPAYVYLHSLSHALMHEIALDCGYPSTSLKERIYALPGVKGSDKAIRCGILIYTAGAGTQGSLGGLVAQAPNLSHLIHRAIALQELCSNDPICGDSDPDPSLDGSMLNGAACHGCLLTAETSCEFRNMLLDRRLLVE